MISNSVKETIGIGKKIAKDLQKGDIICLFGQLGSGKTVLTKGIALGLGIDKDRIISPTFVLIREYSGGRIPLYHLDLYRLGSSSEILFLGYEEYLYDDAVTVIEWPDRLGYLLPGEYLKIGLSIKGDNRRLLEISALGRRYRGLLERINENIGD